MVAQVLLGSGHPEDFALVEIIEVGKIDVGLVENSDFPGLEPRTEPVGSGGVVVGGFLDDREGGQEGAQIESQVALRGGFPAPVFRPAHAVGHQRDGGRVDGVDRALEAPGQALVTQPEMPALVLKVFEHPPEEILHHVGITHLVGMRERVARGRHSTADGGELAGMVTQAVTDVVEPHGMGELGIDQAHHMTEWTEATGLGIDAVFTRELWHEMTRNELAYLVENWES